MEKVIANGAHFSMNTPEARGEIVIEEEQYGFGINFPHVSDHALLSVDLFATSENGEKFYEDVRAQVFIYSPDRVGPIGVIRWYSDRVEIEDNREIGE